jgi:hypothetical protein
MNNFIESVVMSIVLFSAVVFSIVVAGVALAFALLGAAYMLVAVTIQQKEFWYFLGSIVLVWGIIQLIH